MVVDELGTVLDGRHRLKIDPSAPRRVVEGLSDGEKRAFVYRSNLARRNLSHDQRRALTVQLQATALVLKEEGRPQKEIGQLLGVTQQAVALWFSNNTSTGNATKAPDCRVKITNEIKSTVLDHVSSGKTQQTPIPRRPSNFCDPRTAV